ncbi:MAG TPA: rod-binding protein [Phenylobacterium sp.]
MSGALALPPNLALPAVQPSAEDLARRSNVRRTAQDFEASFLSVMLGEMFQGVEAGGMFGGGEGEAMFKSFLTDAMAKQMAKAGGVGLSDTIAREMLKLQGLE